MKETQDVFKKIIWKKRRRLFFSILKWFVFACLVLFLIVWLLLQTERFQNWALQKVTTYLSEELNTTVDVKHIDIDFFDKLVLEDLFIADQAGDTLLYSESLSANFNTNLIRIIRSDLEIDAISLNNTQINIRRDSGQYVDNLQFIIDGLSNPNKKDDPNKKKKPFFLDINTLYLNNISFLKENVPNGNRLFIKLPKGTIKIDSMSLPDNQFAIHSLIAEQPYVELIESERIPLPPLPIDSTTVGEEFVEEPDSLKKELVITALKVRLNDAIFNRTNHRNEPKWDNEPIKIDYNYLGVDDIQIAVDSFKYTEDKFTGKVNHLSLKEKHGFVIEELRANDATISNRRIILNDARLVTPYSSIGDTMVWKYRAYKDFEEYPDKVLMDGRFYDSKVAIKDIMAFAGGIDNNAFFHKNRDAIVELDGRLSGRVNNLKGKNLDIKIGNNLRFQGDFGSRNLTQRNEEILNLNVKHLTTSMQNLHLLLPNFDPPANFEKLGNLDFSGRFDGFFIDFVANGDLRTDLGRAVTNMRLDLKPGRERASYSGKLELIDFDLGAWSNDDQLGNITFSSFVEDGKGLTLETVSAQLGAKIETFTYKGYTYENVEMDGRVNQNLFDGDFSIKDDNIDFKFNGSIDFLDTIPKFDFVADVVRLDLKSLNLIDQDIVISANLDLDLVDKNISDIHGRAALYNIDIQRNQTEHYYIDSLIASSEFRDGDYRIFKIDSEILSINQMDGYFDIQEVPNALLLYFEKNFTGYFSRLNLKKPQKEVQQSTFDFDIAIHDTKNLTHLIDPKLDTLRDISLIGYFDNMKDTLDLTLEAPGFKFDMVEVKDIELILNASKDEASIDIAAENTKINEKNEFPLVSVSGYVFGDSLDFGIQSNDFSQTIASIDLRGLLTLEDQGNAKISFDNSNLAFLNDIWQIDENNQITFGKNYINTEKFELNNGQRFVRLKSVDEKGLQLLVDGFDLSIIDDFWNYNELDFNGGFTVDAQVRNIFTLEDVTATILADTFIMNGDDWGLFRVDAEMSSLKEPVKATVFLTKETQQLTVEGNYYPPTIDKARFSKEANYFDFDADISGFPVELADYWIGNQVSNTTGNFDAKLKIFGVPKEPNIDGWISIYDASIMVDYLQTTYFIDRDTAFVSNFMFDGTGSTITDEYGNVADVYGGISHNHLKNLGLDVRLVSPEFLGMNTTKEDNELFYGTAIGACDVKFFGNFKQPNAIIDATSKAGTKIAIPISYDQDAQEVSFIKFVDKTKKERDTLVSGKDLRGLNVDLNLTVTEDADMSLIFDERAGDVIRGKGRGDLQIGVTRAGDFTMYGDYEIETGEYLFTLYNLINKPFNVKKGGTIHWFGDPFGALIDIDADYKGLSTAPYNFIEEYIDNLDGNIQDAARQPTSVDLTMNLEGELLQPNITFDLAFPRLTSELKNYTDSKLRVVRNDQNELNRQVFGLMVIGGFLPSGNIGGSEVVTGINTVTEFLSNQLSIYLTELLSEVFTDVGFISGVDFDIAYNVYQADHVDLGDTDRFARTGSELQLRLKNNLFNDRLSINVGSNIDLGNSALQSSNGSYVAGDIVIEYILTKDRRFKIRFYQSSQPSIQGGRRNKTGLGLSYRREFDTFKEFLDGMKRSAKRTIE